MRINNQRAWCSTIASGNLQPTMEKNSKIAKIFKWRMKTLGKLDIHKLRFFVDARLPPNPSIYTKTFSPFLAFHSHKIWHQI